MRETCQTTAPILGSEETYGQVTNRYGLREIDDSTARTIASWWQSSGAIGRTLAALASGLEVKVTDLLDDIYRTRREAEELPANDMTPIDIEALDMLATWALNGPDQDAEGQ